MRRSWILVPCAVGCLHALAASGAVAQGAAAPPPPRPAQRDTSIYFAPRVTVKATRPRTTAGGASAIELAIDSALVRPAPTLEQVLRDLPAVQIRANSRGEAQPALRGGEDRQIAVLVDGVPITLAYDHRTDLSIVPLTAARNVTLHRGLSTILTGPNAVGGAVQVDIARGNRADVPPPPLVLDAGVDQTGARSAALSGGTLRAGANGTWTVRGGAGYRGQDGFALARALDRSDAATLARLRGDRDLRLNTDVQAFDAFLALRRTRTSGAWMALTAMGSRIERGVAPEAHTQGPRLWRYPLQARGLAAVSAGTGMRRTPWGRGDLEMSLGFDAGRSHIDEYAALDYRDVIGGERGDDRTVTARLVGDHTLGRRGDLRAALTYADVSRNEVVLPDDPEASYRQRLWSLASETDWRVSLGVPVRLSAGVAADGADTPESGDKPPLDRLWSWGGRAGATAVLRDGALVAHGSSGRRARFPALRELYSGALGRFLPNPSLQPETEWVNEMGATVRHARGQLQVVGFHQVLLDGIARVSVATPEGNKFQRINRGRATGLGLEVVGSAEWAAATVGGDMTLQRVRGRGGTDLEYEPDLYGRAWCEVPVAWRTSFGFEMQGTGAQRFIDLDSGAFGRLPSSLRLDARVSRRFVAHAGPWRRVDAMLAVENLADQTIFDQAGLPQPGRTVRLQARLW